MNRGIRGALPLDPVSVLRPARPFPGEPRGAVWRRPRGRRRWETSAAGRPGSSLTAKQVFFSYLGSPTPYTVHAWCSARGRSSWRCTPPAPSGRRRCGAWPRRCWRSCRSSSCWSSRSSWGPSCSTLDAPRADRPRGGPNRCAAQAGLPEPAFVVVRAVVYFAFFLASAGCLRRWSLRMDRPGARRRLLRARVDADL